MMLRQMVAIGACLVVVGCSGNGTPTPQPTGSNAPTQAAPTSSTSTSGATLQVDQALRARLPQAVTSKGLLVNGGDAPDPPFYIVNPDGTVVGITMDVATALGQLLGIQIRSDQAAFSALLPGVASGRYDVLLGPITDKASRHATYDIIDWYADFYEFIVPTGNPLGITSVKAACGHRIGVLAGGSVQVDLTARSKTDCSPSTPIQVLPFQDLPTAALALQSGRADAVFSSAPNVEYYLKQAHLPFVTAGGNKTDPNFGQTLEGAGLPAGSPLTSVIKDGLQELITDGQYAKILNTWGVPGIALPAVTVDAATTN